MPLVEQVRLAAVPLALVLGAGSLAFVFQETAVVDGPLDPWTRMPDAGVHTDHATFFPDPLETGQDVTRACLECHPDSGDQMLHSQHFKWTGEPVEVPGHDEPIAIGKKNVINNYCIGVQGNWPSCTKCHAGYGWKDDSFDFDEVTNVDCLVCHDQSGGYAKGKNGDPIEDVDLVAAAQSVGRPTRDNCGACHFNGGGGNAVKHGDLDMSMVNPNERIDVHMGRHDFQCVDCHQTEDHAIPGRSISVSVDTANKVYCTDCHDDAPHEDARINSHVETVACQTCHIPSMGTDAGTKMTWDWSTAGDTAFEDMVGNHHEYLAIKGTFEWTYGAMPTYTWWNGRADRYLLGETMDPEETTVIAGPLGDITDDEAVLWPFKMHRGRQIYDAEHKRFIVPRTVGPGGYWTDFDWDQAARLGAESTGLPYSGSYAFAPTEMAWPLSHMVQTKERSLQCFDCHGTSGRMDWDALGFTGDPLTHGSRRQQGLVR